MVPRAGLEPAQPKGRGILNPLCLPISPPGHLWRRVPESNRGTRICNPLHDHSANAPQLLNLLRDWSGKRDSNSRPQPWQGCALPTELFPRLSYTRTNEILHRYGKRIIREKCLTASPYQ